MDSPSGVRLARSLSPDDVGHRVVVRRRLDEGGFADVLGDLLTWDGSTLVVRTRSGEQVRVPLADVAGGKRVPPPPARRPSPAATASLERAAARGWQALETERLGEWLLRASGGFTGRANSVLPIGDPGLPLDQALAAVVEWYGARGLPPKVQLPLPLAQKLDDELASRGWTSPEVNVVLTAKAATVLERGHPGDDPLAGVHVEDAPDEAWLSRYRYRGQELPAVAREVLTRGAEVAFLRLAQPEDPAAAVARAAVSRDPAGGAPGGPHHCWVGVTAVDVSPALRRRGLGSRITAAAVAWGVERGADRVYLQTTEANAPARALYDRLGFALHHRYRYRTMDR